MLGPFPEVMAELTFGCFIPQETQMLSKIGEHGFHCDNN